jgi:hypothetical protein
MRNIVLLVVSLISLNVFAQKTTSSDSQFIDYSEMQIGDYYFADGSVSHELSENKQCVGVVFSLKTTEDERAHGWTHGQIVSLVDAEKGRGFRWMAVNVTPPPCKQMTRMSDCRADKDGYVYCSSKHKSWASVYNYTNAFAVAHYFGSIDIPLPKGKTSGWYLPSIGQWYDIIENIGHVKILDNGCFDDMKRARRNLDEKIGLDSDMYWSSSDKSYLGAWSLVLRAGNINSYDKNYACSVRTVAAF